MIALFVKLAHHGHKAATARLDVIAAGKFILAIELPPWHVDMREVISPAAVVIVGRHLLQPGKVARTPASDAIHQVAPYHPGRIGQSVGKKMRA